MLGGVLAVHDRFGALEGEVTVQLDHGVVRLDGVGAVDLDFVVTLSEERQREQAEKGESQPKL